MKRLVVLLIAFAGAIGHSTTVRAQVPTTAEARFDFAQSAYTEGRFAAAREEFRALLRERAAASVPLLDAIGRCCHELSEHAQAIAAYRSALLRAPGDRDLVAALRRAESDLGMDPAPLSRRERGWTVPIAFVGAGVQLLGIVFWMRRRRSLASLLWVAGLGVSAVGVHDVLVGAGGRAVVVVPEVVLRSEADAAVDASSPRLRAGEIVDLGDVEGDFVAVDHERGAGWVPSGSLARIE